MILDKIKQSMYYIIVGIISFISLVFLPMIGSTAGVDWNLPTTTIGWIIWVIVKVGVASANVLMFFCFMQQGKLNVKDDPRFIEAQSILEQQHDKQAVPLSPKKWQAKQYTGKGISIFLSTALSTVALTQAVLTFDYMAMLTYLFAIILGVVFGVLQMKTAEEYWTHDYWRFAKMKEKELKKNDRN